MRSYNLDLYYNETASMTRFVLPDYGTHGCGLKLKPDQALLSIFTHRGRHDLGSPELHEKSWGFSR